MQFRETKSDPVVLGICGASGQIYARWILKILAGDLGVMVHVVLSNSAHKIITDELGLKSIDEGLPRERIRTFEQVEMENVLASGSFATRGMIICPCSLNTLAAVSAGISDNLIKRAAQVHLKQRRRLILAVREMPLGLIELKNMVRLTAAGAVVTPLCPPFYHHPKNLDELAAFTAQKLVQMLMDVDSEFQYKPNSE